MARFEITEVVQDALGNTISAATYSANDLQGNPLTVYTTEAGSTAVTDLTTDDFGRIEGWVDAPDFDLVVTSTLSSYTQNIRTSPPGVFHVNSYGASPTASSATNWTAITAALTAASSAGGGIVKFGTGTYTVNAMIDSAANYIVWRGVSRTSTVVKLGDSVNNHLLNVTGNGWAIEDLTFDGNRANQTTGHVVRISGDDHTIRRLIVKDAKSYGIGVAEGAATSAKRMHIDSVYILNTGLDGIDSKDTADGNEAGRISNVVVRNPGIDGSQEAGVDCRGPWQLSNIVVLDLSGDDVGIRFRESDAGVTGFGCDGSNLTNFLVVAAAAGTTATGVAVSSDNVAVSNGLTDGITGVSGGMTGMSVAGLNSRVANVECRNGGLGFTMPASGTWSELHGCHGLANNDGFKVDAADVLIQGGSARNNLRYGVNPSTSTGLRIPGLRFSTNASADINYSSTASATTTTLPSFVDYVPITGTTAITSVTASWRDRIVTLKFAGALTFTDGSNLILAGNFVTTADDTITLRSDGTNWIETSRSVN